VIVEILIISPLPDLLHVLIFVMLDLLSLVAILCLIMSSRD
jgi:hypothetical protein